MIAEFDPDAVARAAGEAHLIPRPVRRLNEVEIRRMYPLGAVIPDVADAPARLKPAAQTRRRPARGGVVV